MFGINEILNKFINNEPLTEEERFNLLRSKRIDERVLPYLRDKLSPLYIEGLGKFGCSLFELMYEGLLEGWCWQTTESAVVFLDGDDAYIERGDLYLDERTPDYFHSWISFTFDGVEYVLDSCLNFLCKKRDYFKIFEVEVKAKVTAKAVKDELIRQVKMFEEGSKYCAFDRCEDFLRTLLGSYYDEYYEGRKEEVLVDAPDDVNTPLYKNAAGYILELDGERIKKLVVHYYYKDF